MRPPWRDIVAGSRRRSRRSRPYRHSAANGRTRRRRRSSVRGGHPPKRSRARANPPRQKAHAQRRSPVRALAGLGVPLAHPATGIRHPVRRHRAPSSDRPDRADAAEPAEPEAHRPAGVRDAHPDGRETELEILGRIAARQRSSNTPADLGRAPLRPDPGRRGARRSAPRRAIESSLRHRATSSPRYRRTPRVPRGGFGGTAPIRRQQKQPT